MAPNNSTSLNTTSSVPLFEHVEPEGLRYFRFVLLGIISVASILGNAIVAKSVIANPYRKPLTYYLVTNLAIAELIGTLAIPLLIVYEEMRTWPFGRFLCHIVSPIQVLSGLVVTWSLALISVHRLWMVKSSRARIFKRRTLLMVSLWLFATAITSPLFVYSSLLASPFDVDTYWCFVLLPGDTVFDLSFYRQYHLVRFTLNYIVPFTVMLASYGVIGIRLRYHRAFMKTAVHTELSFGNSVTQTSMSGQPINAVENIELEPSRAPSGSTVKSGQSIADFTRSSTQQPANVTQLVTQRAVYVTQSVTQQPDDVMQSVIQQPDDVMQSVIQQPDDVMQSVTQQSDNVTPSVQRPISVTQQQADVTATSQHSMSTLSDSVLIDLESDLLRMIYVIILVFVICYLPYQILHFLEYFNIVSYTNWRYFTIFRKYVFLVTCLPGALHPICYGTMSTFYARAFSGIVLCKWRARQ